MIYKYMIYLQMIWPTCETCYLFILSFCFRPLTVVRPDHEHDILSLLPQLFPLVADVVSGVRDGELPLGIENAQHARNNKRWFGII